MDLDGLDAGAGKDRVEGGGELAGPVPDQVPEAGHLLAEVQQQVPGLLGGPASVGVGGDIEDVHIPGFHLQHEQDIEPPQRDGLDVEEVNRQRRRRLDPQELPPARVAAASRRRRYPGRFRIRRIVEAATR
jgi:hypothetical protein